MFIPANEFGVVVIFAQQCEGRGWEIVSIGPGYPDAVIRNRLSGETIRAEFEFESGHFIKHRHDPRLCDVIICWRNTLKKFPMTVWALSDWDDSPILQLSPLEKENLALRIDNRWLKAKIKKIGKSGSFSNSYMDFCLAMGNRNGSGPLKITEIRQRFSVSERTAWRWLARWQKEHQVPDMEVN